MNHFIIKSNGTFPAVLPSIFELRRSQSGVEKLMRKVRDRDKFEHLKQIRNDLKKIMRSL